MVVSAFSAKKFLIVDDFSDMRVMLKHMLQLFGATAIDTAANGKDAINLMGRNAYDIVLCDYNLGDGKDGQQVLEEARHKGLIRYSTIFVMVTAENTVAMVMGAVEYEPDTYLTKPFNKDLLRSRLEKLIAKKADFEEIERAIYQKNYLHAIHLCDKRIEQNPRNLADPLKLKGNLYLTLGNYAEAGKTYEQMLSVRRVPWAMAGLGKVRYYSKDYVGAQEIFQEIVQEHKTYMEAYDWLAKTLRELGELDEAQSVLTTAAELSPKAILRQKALGEVALKNKDFKASAQALKKAVKLGRDSVYKNPTDYTNLAKALTYNDAGKEALKVLQSVRKEFDGDRSVALQAKIAEGVVYKESNREKEAHKALEEACKLYEAIADKVSSQVTMDMAKTSFALGDEEKGRQLIRDVVKNHHEDEEILRGIEETFAEMGLQKEGGELIHAAKEEVVQLNNQGVGLVKEGKLAEAVRLFETAAKSMAENKTVNMNAARAMLMYMQKHGRNDRYLYQVRQYLDRVRMIDPSNPTLLKLSDDYKTLVA